MDVKTNLLTGFLSELNFALCAGPVAQVLVAVGRAQGMRHAIAALDLEETMSAKEQAFLGHLDRWLARRDEQARDGQLETRTFIGHESGLDDECEHDTDHLIRVIEEWQPIGWDRMDLIEDTALKGGWPMANCQLAAARVKWAFAHGQFTPGTGWSRR
jgi:hypothetical protein